MSQPSPQHSSTSSRRLLIFGLFVFAALCMVFAALSWTVSGHPGFWFDLGLASLFAGLAAERIP